MDMPTQFPGSVPPPWKIPEERLGKSPSYDIPRPVMVTVVSCYLVLKAVVYIICMFALTGPDSGQDPSSFSAFLIAHGRFVFHELPPPFMPFRGAADVSMNAYLHLLPVAFGIVGIYSAVSAFFLYMLNYWVRWITMFVSGATAIKTIILLSANYVGGETVALTGDQILAIIISVVINLVICLYLAFYPGVSEAFENRNVR
jgi:hypothetical protein